jgi:hypothetical protein
VHIKPVKAGTCNVPDASYVPVGLIAGRGSLVEINLFVLRVSKLPVAPVAVVAVAVTGPSSSSVVVKLQLPDASEVTVPRYVLPFSQSWQLDFFKKTSIVQLGKEQLPAME